jgi:hypothetical protein
MTSPTGRRTSFNPAFAAPYESRAPIVDADYSDLERRIERQGQTFSMPVIVEARAIHVQRCYDSPAGDFAGRFWLILAIHDEDQYSPATASGNARQRRAQIRAWKRQGFTVTQTDARTGAIIIR